MFSRQFFVGAISTYKTLFIVTWNWTPSFFSSQNSMKDFPFACSCYLKNQQKTSDPIDGRVWTFEPVAGGSNVFKTARPGWGVFGYLGYHYFPLLFFSSNEKQKHKRPTPWNEKISQRIHVGNIYLHLVVFNGENGIHVGKYTSPMDPMGIFFAGFFLPQNVNTWCSNLKFELPCFILLQLG